MKLLLCLKCDHIFSLDFQERTCNCNATKGRYINHQDATYSGDFAVPLGFANSSLSNAIKNQPQTGLGEVFTAFVIPKQCPTFICEKDNNVDNLEIDVQAMRELQKKSKIDAFNELAGSALSAGEDIKELLKAEKHEDDKDFLSIPNTHNQKSSISKSIKLLEMHLLSSKETIENLEYYLKDSHNKVSEQERVEILDDIANLKEEIISHRHAIEILERHQLLGIEEDKQSRR